MSQEGWIYALATLAESDYIVLAPGNLFTSTVPNLLVRGIPAGTLSKTGELVVASAPGIATELAELFDRLGVSEDIPD